MNKFIPILLATALSVSAYADSKCRPVNISSTNSSLGMARNQRGLGWCFAYAMSDIVGNELGYKVSPFDMAISLYRTRPEYNLSTAKSVTDISGGNPIRTFQGIQKFGICKESKISASSTFAARFLPKIESLANEASEFTGSSSEIHIKLQRMITENASAFHGVFPTTSMEEMIAALSQLNSTERPLVSLMDNICEKRVPINHLSLGGGVYGDQNVAARVIREKLNEGKPILIGYNSATIKDVTKGGEVTHASTIIGMRPTQSGSCEFLLRNSWGEVRRDYYDPSLRQNFSLGNLWIPHDVLVKTMGWTFWIDRR